MSVKKAMKLSLTEQSLRMWCVEAAMRWPRIVEWEPSSMMSGGGYGSGGRKESDADVIGRAEKLHAWVSGVKA